MTFQRNVFQILATGAILSLLSCATITNDPNIPVAFSFSDGSNGKCTFRNKRGFWESEIPTSAVMIRRSDDALIYDCSTEDWRDVTGSIQSETEGAKLGASVIFFDLGITDAITDKHRKYSNNVVIPIKKIETSQSESKAELVQQCIDACVKASSKTPEECFDVCSS